MTDIQELLASISRWRRQTRNAELLTILDAAERGARREQWHDAAAPPDRLPPKRERAVYMRAWRKKQGKPK